MSAALTTTDLDLRERVEQLEARVAEMAEAMPEERASLLVVSGEMEAVHTALMLAHSAVAMGLETSVYFASWGVQALCANPKGSGKTIVGRCLASLLASDVAQLRSSRMNFGGLGPVLFAHVMKGHSIQTAAELLDLAPECGIELVVCPTSLEMFELKLEEMRPGLAVRGAASFIESAHRSRFAGVF